MELSLRKKNILASVVERYIASGEPIGSRVICDSLNVSSATIRNEMAELSAMGLLEQPHTSAGRIPSQQGFRYYINNIMKTAELSETDKFRIESRFDPTVGDPIQVLKLIGDIISEITLCPIMISTPFDANATIKRVEIIPTGNHSAMVVMKLSTGVIKSTVCKGNADFQMDTVELFYNIANAYFINKPTSELTDAKIQSIAFSLGNKLFEMLPFIVALKTLSEDISQCSVLFSGQEHLMRNEELYSDAQEIMNIIKQEQVITKILNRSADRIRVSIGSENRYKALKNASIITAKYLNNNKEMGSIALLCPIRSDYSKLISILKYTSEFASSVLKQATEE